MYKARGWRLPFAYATQNHLFDFWHGVETHTWQPHETFGGKKNGYIYMCSWTSVVKEATNFVLAHADAKAEAFSFVDIGCGKGKVLGVWGTMFKQQGQPKLMGIDYDERLLTICRYNLEKLNIVGVALHRADASEFVFPKPKTLKLFYMYNPFDQAVMKKVLSSIGRPNAYLIYNNPKYHSDVLAAGFKVLHTQVGWHPNAAYTIYSYAGVPAKCD